MKLDLKDFFSYIDEKVHVEPNKEYDDVIQRLLLGQTVEVVDEGIVKYMVEDRGKIMLLSQGQKA